MHKYIVNSSFSCPLNKQMTMYCLWTTKCVQEIVINHKNAHDSTDLRSFVWGRIGIAVHQVISTWGTPRVGVVFNWEILMKNNAISWYIPRTKAPTVV